MRPAPLRAGSETAPASHERWGGIPIEEQRSGADAQRMTHSLRRIVATVCALVVAASITATPPAQAEVPVPGSHDLGTNVSMPVDWATEVPFVDVFRLSRPWISQRQGQPWGQGGPLAVDANGWVSSLEPGQYADTVMLGNGGHYPTGRYVVLWDGSGAISFMGTAAVVSTQPGRMEIDVAAPRVGTPGGLVLRILATDPADPVRNIRVLMPGTEATYRRQPFNPRFLAAVRGYGSIRFMNWMATNYEPTGDWSARPTAASRGWHQREDGVPVETMVDLANHLDQDPWFTLPHLATDEYVREFARIVRDRLEPELVPYVEYSNETWNAQFPQTAHVIDRGVALGLSPDRFLAGLRYTSQRSVEIFRIWRNEFGEREIRTVIATQGIPSGWALRQVLAWQDAWRETDAAAIAPYFGGGVVNTPALADQVRTWTVDEVLDAVDANLDAQVRTIIQNNIAEAAARGVEPVAYEGGQHLVAPRGYENDRQLVDLLIAANRHPRMGRAYTRYLDLWDQTGGGRFMSFADVDAPGQYGSWGALENLYQDPMTAPKFRALMAWGGRGWYGRIPPP